MRARKAPKAEQAPLPLFNLSQRQEELLRAAREALPRGVYVPITGSVNTVAHELVQGGAADYREEHQTSDTWNLARTKMCEWTDYYLVPTDHGLKLLGGKQS